MSAASVFRERLLARLFVPFAERHRGQPGRAGQALLAAGIDGVGAPGIDQHGRSSERSDRVNDGQTLVRPRQRNQRLGIRLRARRCLGMNKGDQPGVGVGPQCAGELVRIDWVAPGIIDDDCRTAAAFHILDHAPAEHAVDAAYAKRIGVNLDDLLISQPRRD